MSIDITHKLLPFEGLPPIPRYFLLSKAHSYLLSPSLGIVPDFLRFYLSALEIERIVYVLQNCREYCPWSIYSCTLLHIQLVLSFQMSACILMPELGSIYTSSFLFCSISNLVFQNLAFDVKSP